MTCFRLSTGETLHHYCKRTGKNYITIQDRCDRLGLTPDEALVAPPREYKYSYVYNGEPLKKYCIRTGLKYSSVKDRARRLKCSLEESVKHFKERSKSKDGRANR